jgi:hypothetical protein
MLPCIGLSSDRSAEQTNSQLVMPAFLRTAAQPPSCSADEAWWSATKGGEIDAYGSNCNVKLTAIHRLKPSSNAKSHEGSITAWLRSSLQSMRPIHSVGGQDAASDRKT